jgi:ABC-type oligopeptide transport system ATPase subunit
MLNYANLNDVEFEYLCQDIMQKKLDTELHRFAKGKDGGIDLADDAHSKNIIVQVKHYMTSSVSKLISTLRDEMGKVARLAPKEYYICCSKELSPQKVDEIYQLFSAYMSSTSNIITLNEIDHFLNDSANIEILKKHYKLWIETTGILQDIGNTNIFIDCETLLADIENEQKLFVKTSAFSTALKYLQDNKTLFIIGQPGAGKTITSKMLVLYYAAIRYRVRFSTNVSNLDELKKSLSRNPETKEIILVDDCFGQAYFNMKESQNEELLSLINYVNMSANKLLILNSRITILKEATERKPELLKCIEGNQCKVYTLNMDEINVVEKAKIFYNHISFTGMAKEYFAEIKKEERYCDIIKHPNYTPRIIEFICNRNRYKHIPPDNYYEFVMQQLNNPKEIWKDEYERRLGKVDRLLLLTLYSLSDSAVSEEKVKICFEHRMSCEPDIDTTINQYEASLSRLLDGFVQLVSESGTKKLAMVNPSVNDYIDGWLNENAVERKRLVDYACSIQQKKRLLSENNFEAFAQSALENHKIEEYMFDSEEQKTSFIAFYICKYKIHDDMYTPCIQAFLSDPCYLRTYGNEPVSSIEIIREILKEDNCEFYNIGEFLRCECKLEDMLVAFDFDKMIEVICLIERFFNDGSRDAFIEIVSEQLRYAIESVCVNLDADEFDPDVEHAIEMFCYSDGEDIDEEKAVSYIWDEIISEVENEIDYQLSMLPEDIKCHQNYTDNLEYSINGTDDLIKSYYEYDNYDYEYYRESLAEYEDPDLEIDYIFDRN